MKIVVLAGGLSTERSVSLATGVAACKALRKAGHQAVFVDMFLGLEDYDGALEDLFADETGRCSTAAVSAEVPDIAAVMVSRKLKSKSRLGKNVLELCQLADCVFLGLHGKDGEDGKIQAALDLLGIPYTGSGHLGSAMAMDKSITKLIMQSCGVLTPKWENLYFSAEDIPELTERLQVPCVVKTVDGGSSIGVEMPDTKEELEAALRKIAKLGSHIIVEEKIRGRELTQPVLGDGYLAGIEIIPPEGNTFDYVAKYQSGAAAAREICPADIPAEVQQRMGEAALELHRALGLSVYSRTDFILDRDGKLWCLEVNTLPGMTGSSLLPKAAKHAGMSYEQLCDTIVQLSLQKPVED